MLVWSESHPSSSAANIQRYVYPDIVIFGTNFILEDDACQDAEFEPWSQGDHT